MKIETGAVYECDDGSRVFIKKAPVLKGAQSYIGRLLKTPNRIAKKYENQQMVFDRLGNCESMPQFQGLKLKRKTKEQVPPL